MSARRDWTHASPALRRPNHAEMSAWEPAFSERRAWGIWVGLCAVVMSACVVVIGLRVLVRMAGWI